MFRKRALAGLLVLAFVLSACGQNPAAGPTSNSTAATTGDVVTLRVGTGDSGDGLTPYNNIIAAFEAANPGIKVVVEPVTAGDYYASLLTKIAGGNPPDLMLVGEDAVPRFVEAGAFEDLGPYISDPNYSLDPSIYLPGVYRPGEWQGKQYLLPKDYSTVAVYYNKKLFDEAGVPYPQAGWTWQEFLETAQKLTDPAKGQYGVQLPANWSRGFEYWAAAAGGQLISEDGTRIQGYMDSDAVVEALQFYADLYNKYKVAAPPTDLSAFGGGVDNFETGRAAMRLFGRWPQAGYLNNPNLKDALGVVPPPVGKQSATVIAWAGFGISSASKHKAEAWRFLRFMSGPEGANEWANWGLPAVQSVAEAKGIDKDALNGAWLASLNDLKPIAAYASQYWGEAGEPELRKALEGVVTNPNPDVKALLSEAARNAQAALDAKLNR